MSAAVVPDSGGTTVAGDGHTHDNKSTLDRISADEEGYQYLIRNEEVTDEESGTTTVEPVARKVKAGYADEAGRAEMAHDLDPDSPVRKEFLSRTKDDRSAGKVASDVGFEVGDFVAGASGAKAWLDEVTGLTSAEVDKLYVRVRAYFEVLSVIEAEVLAGKQYITPGGGVRCARVEETAGGWRCYFLTEQDGEKTEGKFIVGDMAISEMFNAKAGTANKVSNHRYWRKVLAVSNDAYTDDAGNRYGYIELSRDDCEAGSDEPKGGDEICQLGHESRRDRQTAMVFSTVDSDSPCIKLYTGINTYSLAGRDIVAYGYNAETGRAYFRCYGDCYMGAPDGSSSIEYDSIKRGFILNNVTLTLGSKVGDKVLGDIINKTDASILDTDVLYIQTASRTQRPNLPVLDSQGGISDMNGWSTDAPAWQAGMYIWQTTCVRRGDGSGSFSEPVCISGADGKPGQGFSPNLIPSSYYNPQREGAKLTKAVWLPKEATNNGASNNRFHFVTGVITEPGWYSYSFWYKLDHGAGLLQCDINDSGNLKIANPGDNDWHYAEGSIYVDTLIDRYGFLDILISDTNTAYLISDIVVIPSEHPLSSWVPTADEMKGTSGASAKVVTVNADATAFMYENDFKTLVGPQNITVTAELQGTSGYYWEVKTPSMADFVSLGKTGNSYVLSPNASGWGNDKSMTLRCSSGGVHDEVTIVKVSSGSNGTDGADGSSYTENLLLKSNERKENGNYPIGAWYFGDTKPVEGEVYTLTAWGVELAEGVTDLRAFNSGGNGYDGSVLLYKIADGLYRGYWTWKNKTDGSVGTHINIYAMPGGKGVSIIEKVKLEKGRNENPVWSPAPSEMLGTAGQDAYTVVLSNESHVFEGDTQKAVPSNTSCGVIAYKGSARVPATIGAVSGMPPGMSVGVVNNGTVTAGITVSVTDGLTTGQGELTIPITVEGITFERKFSWSLSLRGEGGANYTPNLLVDTKEERTVVSPNGTGDPYNYRFATYRFDTPMAVEPGDKFALRIEGIEHVEGDAPNFTVWLFNTNENSGYSSSGSLTLENRDLVLTVSRATTATTLIVYGGQIGHTAGNTVKFSRVMLVKGDKPMAWSPASSEMVGTDGVGIDQIVEEYYLSTSRITPQGGSWSAIRPEWESGKYYWTRSHIYYSDGTEAIVGEICATGDSGADGASVLARYSADKVTWHMGMLSTDVWMQTSQDNGKTWSEAVRIVGNNYTNNLLSGTKDWSGDHWENLSRGDVTDETWQGLTVLAQKIRYAQIFQPYEVKANKTYTFSCWVKASANERVQYYGGQNPYFAHFDATTEWKLFSITFTATEDQTSSVRVEKCLESDTVLYIAGYKLEEGDNPDPQWTPHPSDMVGADGKDGKDGPYQKMQWAKNSSPTTAPTSGWQDAPMSANEGGYVWLRTGTVIPPATAPASYGTPVRLTGDRGKDGQSVYLLDLTNSMAGVACDADGNPVGALPSTGIQVYTGGTADNTGWKFSASTDGCTCTLSGWLLKITSVTKDTASVTITATKTGCPTLISTFSVYKVKPGQNGAQGKPGTNGTNGTDGAPAVVYSIDPSVDNITRSSTGRLSAEYVTCSVYKTTGASARVLTSEKTLTYLRMPDGATGTLNHTGGTSSQIPILADTESVIFELKDGSTLLDHERVPVMNDASDLTIYARGTGNNNSANRVVKVGGKTVVNGDGRGLALTVVDRKTLEVAYTRYFDVYDVEEHRTNLATVLRALTTDVFVVITSHDAWYHNNNKDMIEALEDFGGSQFVESDQFKAFRCPYVLIGMKGLGRGNGIERMEGQEKTDPYAEVTTVISNGICSGWKATRPFNYLTAALEQEGELTNGLALLSHIAVGYKNTDGQRVNTAGLNGLIDPEGEKDDLAVWAGGEMIDPKKATAGQTPSTSGIRMNGTAYFCDNVIRLEKDHMMVGDNVRLDKEGLKLLSDGNIALEISNKAISTDFDKLVSNQQQYTRSLSLRVPLDVSGPQTYIKDDVYQSISLGSLSAGSTIEIKVRIGGTQDMHSYPRPTHGEYPLDQELFRVVLLRNGSEVAEQMLPFSIRTVELGSGAGAYKVHYYNIYETLLRFQAAGAGDYTVEFGVDGGSDAENWIMDMTMTGSAQFLIKEGLSNQITLGNNGVSVMRNNNAFAINDGMVIARSGSYGLQLHPTLGIRATINGGQTWYKLSLSGSQLIFTRV